jgi:hypothetical protein
MEDLDIVNALSNPPSTCALRYHRMEAYGNHYWAESCGTEGMVSYDRGVASIFHEGHAIDEDNCVPYVGTLKEILILDYAPIPTPIIFMRCAWVNNGTDIRGNPTYKHDEAEFLLANFRYLMEDHEEPFMKMNTIHNGKLCCIRRFVLSTMC